MKNLILPIVTTTIIASQFFSVGSFAATNNDDCMSLLFEGTESTNSTMNDSCMESMFWETQKSTMSTMGSTRQKSTEVQNNIDAINESITDWISMNSASVENNYVYTPWELLHRTPMLAGFMWTWPIASYITPAMYIGTPFEKGGNYIGWNNPFASFLTAEATNYDECVKHEAYLSFWLGDLIEDTDIKELKSIAKACAKEYYWAYFGGKSYTTREEFLMMLFTLFEEEDVGIQWEFTIDGKYIAGINDGSETGYINVDPKSWYASYLKLAWYLGMVNTDSVTWEVGKSITDTEAVEMLSSYTSYSMNFEWETMDKGIITTEKMNYTLAFPSTQEVSIKIQ